MRNRAAPSTTRMRATVALWRFLQLVAIDTVFEEIIRRDGLPIAFTAREELLNNSRDEHYHLGRGECIRMAYVATRYLIGEVPCGFHEHPQPGVHRSHGVLREKVVKPGRRVGCLRCRLLLRYESWVGNKFRHAYHHFSAPTPDARRPASRRGRWPGSSP